MLVASVLEAAVGADGRAEGHDGGAADFLQAFGEDGVGINVGQDGKTFLNENFRGFEGFNGVGEQVAGVGMYFQFDPFGETGGDGEAGEADGFPGVHGAAGVGEEEVFLGIDKFEDVGKGIALAGEVGAAQGDGDHFGAAGGQGVAHGFGRGKFARAQDEAGTKLAAGNHQRLMQ